MFKRIVAAGLISALSLSLLLFNSVIVTSPLKTWDNAKKSIVTSSNIIYVPDNYTTIQAAINAANPGDTIFVSSGIYPENLVVNKSLTLIGENKSTTIIDGEASINVVRVVDNNVNISGFTIRSTGAVSYWGVSIEGGQNTLQDNIITAGYGIKITGVNNTICSNTIIYIAEILNWGTVFVSGKGTTTHNNTIHGQIGIFSSDNTITKNRINGTIYGIRIEGSKNTINNNTIIECSDDGVYVKSGNNTILGNTISKNYRGIEIYSAYNNVSNNVISNNTKEGILAFWDSGNNIIFGNNISYNEEAIYLWDSDTNVLKENQMIGNRYGLHVIEEYAISLPNDIDTSNTVNGKPVYYLANQNNLTIDPSTFPEIGYLGIWNSSNIVIRDLDFSESGQGIYFRYTKKITIQNVTVSNNRIGIHLQDSNWDYNYQNITDSEILNNEVGITLQCTDRTVIRNNTILNNSIYGVYFDIGMGGYDIIEYNTISGGEYGIYDWGYAGLYIVRGNTVSNNTYGIYLRTPDVKIYHNNFINNTNQVVNTTRQYSSDWQHEGIGNYWSDYNGTDLNGDGIGDTNLPWQKVDNYPLMNPWRALFQFSHPENISIFQVHLKIDTYFSRGFYLIVKFYSYGGLYQGNVTVWNGTTPAYVDLSINVSHPLDNPLDWNERIPVENATLVLTDENGTIISSITTFVMTRSHLFERLPGLDWLWMIEPPLRPEIFKEIIYIDGQWPYTPY